MKTAEEILIGYSFSRSIAEVTGEAWYEKEKVILAMEEYANQFKQPSVPMGEEIYRWVNGADRTPKIFNNTVVWRQIYTKEIVILTGGDKKYLRYYEWLEKIDTTPSSTEGEVCDKCGNPASKYSCFCKNCGHHINSTTSPSTETKEVSYLQAANNVLSFGVQEFVDKKNLSETLLEADTEYSQMHLNDGLDELIEWVREKECIHGYGNKIFTTQNVLTKAKEIKSRLNR